MTSLSIFFRVFLSTSARFSGLLKLSTLYTYSLDLYNHHAPALSLFFSVFLSHKVKTVCISGSVGALYPWISYLNCITSTWPSLSLFFSVFLSKTARFRASVKLSTLCTLLLDLLPHLYNLHAAFVFSVLQCIPNLYSTPWISYLSFITSTLISFSPFSRVFLSKTARFSASVKLATNSRYSLLSVSSSAGVNSSLSIFSWPSKDRGTENVLYIIELEK